MEEAANTNLVGVGDRIREARQEAGLTQDELSDLIGVGMRQIQYYESGESNPYRTLRRIAEATDRTVGWLLHGDPTIGPGEDAAEAAASLARRLEAIAENQAEVLANQEAAKPVLAEIRDSLAKLVEAARTDPTRTRKAT